jgi:hypothetical protein
LLIKKTMTTIEEKTVKIYIAKLEKENELMKKLSTSKGFYEYYFEFLKVSKTKVQAFNNVNKLYLNFFGRKRYDDFSTFKQLQSL